MIFVIIAIILAVMLALCAGLIAPGKFPRDQKTLFDSKFAHRGLHTKDKSVSENALTAFDAAVQNGYGIELDLCLTADGEVVVFHDDSLKRVCGIDQDVADCTYETLQTYRLHDTDERIPLFSEVLALVGGRAPLIVEFKTTKHNTQLCEKAAAMLDAYGGPYCIESFHPGIVRWFAKNRPNVVRGQLSAGARCFDTLPLYQRIMLSSLCTNVLTRPHFVAYRHEDARHRFKLWLYRLLGGKCVAWTVRDTDDTEYCTSHFDAIIFEFFRP